MKVIEILNFNRELLKRLQAAGIRLEDARYMAAFGGGMGCGSVCGALIGAESALGRYMVSRLPEGSTPIGDSCPELRELAAQYHERFCQEFGSEFCRELK